MASTLARQAIRRDGGTCQACGLAARPTLAVHHIIPLELSGKDEIANVVVLCANCHRSVHWLAAADRSAHAHAFGLGADKRIRRRLLGYARQIQDRRNKVVRPGNIMSSAVPLATALQAVGARNGFERAEAALMRRCVVRMWRAIAPSDRRRCSAKLVRGAKFLSINANNHLAIRTPVWSDDGYRMDGDICLIWQQAVRPSVMSARKFRREAAQGFKLVPCCNLSLSWDECLDLEDHDLEAFREAVHIGLTAARTRRWVSNVVMP